MFATNVANSVEDQETYSMAMIDAASKGQVPVGAVLEDESILPQLNRVCLMQLIQIPGLGQIR